MDISSSNIIHNHIHCGIFQKCLSNARDVTGVTLRLDCARVIMAPNESRLWKHIINSLY